MYVLLLVKKNDTTSHAVSSTTVFRACIQAQPRESPLIHIAASIGDLDTLTNVIEEKGVDPCLRDQV